MFNQQAANARQIEELKQEKDVVVCHHCHCKVHIVDFCNSRMALGGAENAEDDEDEDDDMEMEAMEQMQGEEFAMWMGVGDSHDAQ